MFYKILHNLIKPASVIKWFSPALLFTSTVGISLLSFGLYTVFFDSPPDYQQGETVRIMYIHVPASWGALATYLLMTILSFVGLVRRIDLAHLLVKSLATTGFCFTLISVLTGSIWGKPTWGTWWEWDARLTSMLILLFIYAGYLALVNSYDNTLKGNRLGAFLILVGAFNLPIIKWSVTWWNTLHQPAGILQLNRPSSVHPSMLKPLIVMAMVFMCYGFILTLINYTHAILKSKKSSLLNKKL